MQTTAPLLLTALGILGPVLFSQPKNFDQTDLHEFKETADRIDFQGTMVIFQGNEMIFEKSRGLSQFEKGAENSSKIRFNIGSNGKCLTSILIFKEVEAGNIDLDLPISTYLNPGQFIPNQDLITVRQLLSHTSGLGDFFESPEYREEEKYNVSKLFELVQAMDPVGTPPLKFLHYSNSGFIVLGKILENLHQKSYAEILESELLDPLGIELYGSAIYAQGWKTENGAWVPGLGNDPESWSSAGGIFLSVEELHRVIFALAQGNILKKESLEKMWAVQSRPEHDPPFVGYALGWMVEKPKDLHFIGHNGGIPGFQSGFRYIPDSDTYLYTFSNRDNGAEELFMSALMRLIQKSE